MVVVILGSMQYQTPHPQAHLKVLWLKVEAQTSLLLPFSILQVAQPLVALAIPSILAEMVGYSQLLHLEKGRPAEAVRQDHREKVEMGEIKRPAVINFIMVLVVEVALMAALMVAMVLLAEFLAQGGIIMQVLAEELRVYPQVA